MFSALDNTFGAVIIGVIVASFLLGLSAVQAFIYFSQQNDPRPIRTLVTFVVLFDFIHQALISHTGYYYLVTNYTSPVALGTVIWSLLVEVLFNGFTAFLAQSFLTWKIYRLSERNLWLTGIASSIVLAEFACVTAFGAISLARVRTYVELAEDLKGLSITVNALAAAGDVLIAGILSVLFQTSKTGFRRSQTMLNRLTLFAVSTGALTSLCAVASLISILAAPDTFIYITFFFAMGRLYTNSLLATLNARNAIRRAGNNVQSTSDINIPVSSFGKTFKNAASFASKKFCTPGEIPIQVEITKHKRLGDFGSPQGSEYELSKTCSTGNLFQADIESNVSLPSPAHFNAV
ncbi:hypothetical protein BT96DRAFT_1026698 [Gymnopus androsaceus JB14]|uniref:DUF6534 domain-containing protein n=1 Tax=Gymnopus androsaceus JB14 TaxID=1447944 RepID=A0A6A4GHI3_9AGAR|nr:hypothetical protein BT96DRAFT_1026698 [Gymnopus androsaceus JB14]